MKTEPGRTREQGTVVVLSKNGLERIAACTAIVAARQYAKIDGFMVDGFTASAIMAVWAALNDANRERFLTLSIEKMAWCAFKIINK